MYLVYFRRLLLSKWITNKTCKMLIMQRMVTLLYEPKIKLLFKLSVTVEGLCLINTYINNKNVDNMIPNLGRSPIKKNKQ